MVAVGALEGREVCVLGWMRRYGHLELTLDLRDGGKRSIPAQHASLDDDRGGPGPSSSFA